MISAITIAISLFIGSITFSGSLIAYGKLAEILPGRPLVIPGQLLINLALLGGIVYSGFLFALDPISAQTPFYIFIGLSLSLGIFAVSSIGGGDMPVVIALLNSYSGLAASAAGFVVGNLLLIVAGLLVGASALF